MIAHESSPHSDPYYISITGIHTHRGFAKLRFWLLALPSLMQAKRAPGNILTLATSVQGVHHTLSVWTDKASMRAFLVSGAHRKAMQMHNRLGTVRVHGFSAAEIPDWPTALEYLRRDGRDH